MKGLAEFPRLHLYSTPIDFRRGIDYMASLIVEATSASVFSGELFAFTNRRRNRLRMFYWDESGYAVWMKRLDKERFVWPRRVSASHVVTVDELRWLLMGLNIDKMKGHAALSFTQHS